MPVKIVGPESETQIVDLLSIAFADDPVCRSLYPNLLQYLKFFPEYVRLYGAPGLEHGGAHLLEGIATALWVPRAPTPTRPLSMTFWHAVSKAMPEPN